MIGNQLNKCELNFSQIKNNSSLYQHNVCIFIAILR